MNQSADYDDNSARVLGALRSQEAANKVLESAGVQLSRLVLILEDPGEPLSGAGEWQGEVFRRLLEFLNAAHALAARVTEMAALSGSAAIAPAGPLAAFMAEIRTGMKHRAVPRMTLAQFAPPAPKLRELRMDLSEMISWPHWSAPARQFLHLHQPELPLFSAVHDYLQMLRMFQQRTVRHFRQAFAEILACAPPQPVMIPLM